MTPQSLDRANLDKGLAYLANVDTDLARIVDELGPPTLWGREPGFPTLIHIILEQQVSLASAKAAFEKLQTAVPHLTPANFLTLTDDQLKRFGFSRQKARYGRLLAQAILNGDLDLAALANLSDDQVRKTLTQIKGIGPWTAEIYLLRVLRRPDSWPSGDLALAKAVQQIKQLPGAPSPEQLTEIAVPWQPWRALAARILWHFYLSSPPPSTNLDV